MRAVLLDFPNVIRRSDSNSDSDKSHFAEVVMLKNYVSTIFTASFAIFVCCAVITRFGHYVILASNPSTVPWGLC